MASPLPPRRGKMGEMNSSGGLADIGDLLAMHDFQIGQTPALQAHVAGHDAKTLRLDLTGGIAEQRMLAPNGLAGPSVEEGREDQPIAMAIGTHEQHRSAHRIEARKILA